MKVKDQAAIYAVKKKKYSYQDYLDLPDDGKRYELINCGQYRFQLDDLGHFGKSTQNSGVDDGRLSGSQTVNDRDLIGVDSSGLEVAALVGEIGLAGRVDHDPTARFQSLANVGVFQD